MDMSLCLHRDQLREHMADVPLTVASACEDPHGPFHRSGGTAASHCQLCAARAPAHLPLLPEYVPL